MPIEKEKCVHGYDTGGQYDREIKRAERACNRLHKECSAIDFDCEHQDEFETQAAYEDRLEDLRKQRKRIQ